MTRARSIGWDCSGRMARAPGGTPRAVSLRTVRRLTLTKQGLAGPRKPATRDGMMALIRDVRALQLDPTSAVARSHLLVLWSRLGPYDPALMDELLFREHMMFEYWAHAASIVLTEDYPLHRIHMRTWPGTGRGESASGRGWTRTRRCAGPS